MKIATILIPYINFDLLLFAHECDVIFGWINKFKFQRS